jgi:hypothetical protein
MPQWLLRFLVVGVVRNRNTGGFQGFLDTPDVLTRLVNPIDKRWWAVRLPYLSLLPQIDCKGAPVCGKQLLLFRDFF